MGEVLHEEMGPTRQTEESNNSTSTTKHLLHILKYETQVGGVMSLI